MDDYMEWNAFMKANTGLSESETGERVQRISLSVLDWIKVNKECRGYSNSYNLQVASAKMAVSGATTLADWVAIADNLKGQYRDRAREEVLKFEITTQADIDTLYRSSCFERVGWYLDGKRKQKQ